MATKQYAGNMPDGGLVQAIEQPMTFEFAWGGTASASTPATLAASAGSYPSNTTVKVGATCFCSVDGKAYGCVVGGATSATTPAFGPGATAVGQPNGAQFSLACGISVPTWLDGTVRWIQLSGPTVVQAAWLANLDKTATPNLLYHSSLSTVVVDGGGAVPNNGGAWKFSGAALESIYVIGDAASLFSVAVIV